MADVVLKLAGGEFRGWKSMSIERGIEQAAGRFTLEVTERYPGQPDQWAMHTGMACQLLLDGTVAITGFVDSVQRSLSASNSGLTVAGRDKTADIIDSAAVLPGSTDKTGQLDNIALADLARQLCQPHGIAVQVATGLDAGQLFDQVSIDPGDTVWETLARYARQRAVLMMSDGAGRLVITRAGTARHPAALVEGVNILDADWLDDASGRFRHYLALGQSASSETWPGVAALHPKGPAADKTIRANRRLLVLAETLADGVTLADRAAFERDIRIAQGKQLTISVAGFSARGVLWQPNQRVAVKLPRWGLDAVFLVQMVRYTLGEDGSRTQLTLVPPAFYQRLPEGEASEAATKKWPPQDEP